MRASDRTRRLGEAVWAQTQCTELVVVPVGSLEQHGPHLPLDTDATIARAVADDVAAALTAAGTPTWVTPALALGSSGEHQAFPGTISIGTQALHLVIVETVRSVLTWAPRVLLVNGHGGNHDAVVGAVAQLRHEGHDVTWAPCSTPGSDAHAGRVETSLMLWLRPRSVRLELAERGCTRPLPQILPAMRDGGVADVAPNGVLGDPAGATADEGRRLLLGMVQSVRDTAGLEGAR